MALARDALSETRRAFDAIASSYEADTRSNRVLSAKSSQARREVLTRARLGSRILELGCGPGRDAVFFAQRGYDVTTTDWSSAMVGEASRAIGEAAVAARARALVLGIHELDRLAPESFDVVYSSLGPLNCVLDLEEAAHGVRCRLRDGGLLIVSVMGRWCPWELAVLPGRGQARRARQRFVRGATNVSMGDETVWVSYYTPREFARYFAGAGLAVESWRGLGLVSPPPYLSGSAARWPKLTSALLALDDRIGGWPGLRALGDHFLMTLRKR